MSVLRYRRIDDVLDEFVVKKNGRRSTEMSGRTETSSILCLKQSSHLWLAITLIYMTTHKPISDYFGKSVTTQVRNQKMRYFLTLPN